MMVSCDWPNQGQNWASAGKDGLRHTGGGVEMQRPMPRRSKLNHPALLGTEATEIPAEVCLPSNISFRVELSMWLLSPVPVRCYPRSPVFKLSKTGWKLVVPDNTVLSWLPYKLWVAWAVPWHHSLFQWRQKGPDISEKKLENYNYLLSDLNKWTQWPFKQLTSNIPEKKNLKIQLLCLWLWYYTVPETT